MKLSPGWTLEAQMLGPLPFTRGLSNRSAFIDEPEAVWSVGRLPWLARVPYTTYHPTISRSNTQTILKDGLAAVTKILSGFPHRGAYLKRSSSVANR